MKNIALALLTLLPTTVFAGYTNISCKTNNENIEINFENFQAPRIKIHTTSDGQVVIYDYALNLMPDYDGDKSADAITAIPFTNKVYSKKSHQILRLTHKDGTWCEGRERWNNTYAQNFVLTAKDGQPLRRLAPTTIGKYMTEDMYLVSTITCNNEGVSSPGGCYAQDGDVETWIDVKD